MAISRFSTSRLTLGLPKSQTAWDQDAVQQGAIVPIATQELNGTVTAFGFGSIPQIYQDLMIVVSVRNVANTAAAGWIINGNPASVTYGNTTSFGNGATSTSSRGTSMSYGASLVGSLGSLTSPIPASMIAHFPNYTNSTTKKTFIVRTGSDLNGSGLIATEVFSNSYTTAITDIACSTANAAAFWAGNVTLYGIKAGA